MPNQETPEVHEDDLIKVERPIEHPVRKPYLATAPSALTRLPKSRGDKGLLSPNSALGDGSKYPLKAQKPPYSTSVSRAEPSQAKETGKRSVGEHSKEDGTKQEAQTNSKRDRDGDGTEEEQKSQKIQKRRRKD
ncbi:hypothetical protein BD410DRAFT_808944 [Rickenella mellea]|uniref:Uncharacterized protein n=1 Tax=Rickenella mellea TaxID=50990 RepID=A0A4Y7PJ63_9AGAM|nr:hypothetical protein BD410DRAFT_808944 [Rickenella mellea]